MSNQLLRFFLIVSAFFHSHICDSQVSQILLGNGKTLFMKEMECTNRILFLRPITTHNGPFAEIYELSLTPSDSDFVRRSSFQLSSDSIDFLTWQGYQKKMGKPAPLPKATPSITSKPDAKQYDPSVPPPAEYSQFADIGDAEEKVEFGNIPKDFWDESGLLDLNFFARDNVVSFSVSNEADEVLRTKYPQFFSFNNSSAYPSIYESLDFFTSVYYPGAMGYYHTKRKEILVDDFYITKRILSKLSGCVSNPLIPVEVDELEAFYCRTLNYRGSILSFPDIYSGVGDNHNTRINDSLDFPGIRLNHRDLFSVSKERNILVLIANDSLRTQENVQVKQAYQILNLKLNEGGLLVEFNSYSLPQDVVFRIYDGVSFCPLVHLEGTPILQSHVLAIKLYHHLEVLNNSCLDSDGTLVFFGYKGGLSEVILSTSIKSGFETKAPSEIPKSGLFRLASNGVSEFIPTEFLFDLGCYRDSTVNMIQSKNGAHWLIGGLLEDKSKNCMLMVQDSKTQKFKTYCTLPSNFEPVYLSEVSDNKIAIYGEQIANENNRSFLLEKTKVNSVLLVDVSELTPKRSKNKLKVTHVDLNSGHVYCTDSKTHKDYFFPIKLEVNAPNNYQGVVLLNGTEVSFAKVNNQLKVDGVLVRSTAKNREDVLSEVINNYFLGK